ncbi:transcriptional repressor DicA [uncultured Clostridium sp.]|nr:transcriptional repressor DicA [uncultured Clostridium sp.]
MELSIGEVIYKLRKERGVTQEVLAKAVGVSVAAVSKWESKNSYPDITILPSIARYFNTTIDKLLSYEIEISNEEVMNIMKECASLFEKNSPENATKVCESYIRQYPNSMFLKFRAGSLYMMSIPSASSEDEAENMLNRAIELLEVSSQSEELEIIETSKYILSSLYTMKNEFEKAEEVILSLPKVSMDRDDMLIGLYINQDRVDDAKEILKNLTYKRVNSVLTCLNYYTTIYLKEDISKAKEILDIQDKVIKVFGLDDICGIGNNMTASHIHAKDKNMEKTLEAIENIIESAGGDYNLDNHILFDGVKLFEGVHSKEYIVLNLKKLLDESIYDFIRNEDKYKEILSKIDEFGK